jgi:hypothetical protein
MTVVALAALPVLTERSLAEARNQAASAEPAAVP